MRTATKNIFWNTELRFKKNAASELINGYTRCMPEQIKDEEKMLSEYIAELKKQELLTPERERELWARYAAGDAAAHNELMTAYQLLVFKTAMTFHLPEDETLELIQEGTVGLLEAAERFDYKRGVAFSLFALHRVRGAMYDFLKRENGVRILSLDDIDGEGLALAEALPSPAPGPAELAERTAVNERVREAVNRLPEKERQVLHGLLVEEMAAADVADVVKVSTAYVYRLQKQGVRRVRGMLSRFMHDLKN